MNSGNNVVNSSYKQKYQKSDINIILPNVNTVFFSFYKNFKWRIKDRQKTFNWIVIFTTNRKGALRPWQMAYNFISIDGKLRKKCAAKHKLAMGNTS